MKNSKVLFLDLANRIKINESDDEIKSMASIIMEYLFSVSGTDILLEKEVEVVSGEEKQIDEIVRRINANEPVQYVLGETIFYRRIFFVDPSVLIPRPETEELVSAVLSHLQGSGGRNDPSILDIGTGSGCIPITLALECGSAQVSATDISDEALKVAGKNALRLKAPVQFFKNDILKENLPVNNLDVVVSNPPYIPCEEKASMRDNVIAFEPHIALFVPDNDPLLFYKAIVEKSLSALRSGGLLALEINERFGKDIVLLMEKFGFRDVEVVRDIFYKERIVKGILP